MTECGEIQQYQHFLTVYAIRNVLHTWVFQAELMLLVYYLSHCIMVYLLVVSL